MVTIWYGMEMNETKNRRIARSIAIIIIKSDLDLWYSRLFANSWINVNNKFCHTVSWADRRWFMASMVSGQYIARGVENICESLSFSIACHMRNNHYWPLANTHSVTFFVAPSDKIYYKLPSVCQLPVAREKLCCEKIIIIFRKWFHDRCDKWWSYHLLNHLSINNIRPEVRIK